MEVDFSEKYPRLVQDAKLWLEGMLDVSIVMIVGFQESPTYQPPLCELTDQDIGDLYQRYQDTSHLRQQSNIAFDVRGEFGPVSYEGLTWAGEIDAFIELWIRDPVTGLTIQNGNRINLLPPAEPPQLEFRLSNFTDDVPPDKDVPTSFAWDGFQEEMRMSIKETAYSRYIIAMENYVKERRKKATDESSSSRTSEQRGTSSSSSTRGRTPTQGDTPGPRRTSRPRARRAR
ncbi:hypothetical protein GP486_005836 [Trichoglossum hirsutum]|uniref:Uncharacterized protein n=1 Tax=Trichoglossum hirsutum TaxID=265104 RepID=A0A9P8L8I1_9PEZI|nr:hypothetical protein GP486_005836 [Trichoglossum hirsutum]